MGGGVERHASPEGLTDELVDMLRRGTDDCAGLMWAGRYDDDANAMAAALVTLAHPVVTPVLLSFYFEAVALLAEGLGLDQATVHARVADKAYEASAASARELVHEMWQP